jgi:hypothetical protein
VYSRAKATGIQILDVDSIFSENRRHSTLLTATSRPSTPEDNMFAQGVQDALVST